MPPPRVSSPSHSIAEDTAEDIQEEVAAKANLLIVTLKPGKIGITADWPTGCVTKIGPDSQGQRAGVAVGMIFKTLDGEEYCKSLLDIKAKGSDDYEVTFEIADEDKAPLSPPPISSPPPVSSPPPISHAIVNGADLTPFLNEANLLTVTFKPGKIGIVADWANGSVTKIGPDSQGQRAGVTVGMIFKLLDGQEYCKSLLDIKAKGSEDYKVAFEIADEDTVCTSAAILARQTPKESADSRSAMVPQSSLPGAPGHIMGVAPIAPNIATPSASSTVAPARSPIPSASSSVAPARSPIPSASSAVSPVRSPLAEHSVGIGGVETKIVVASAAAAENAAVVATADKDEDAEKSVSETYGDGEFDDYEDDEFDEDAEEDASAASGSVGSGDASPVRVRPGAGDSSNSVASATPRSSRSQHSAGSPRSPRSASSSSVNVPFDDSQTENRSAHDSDEDE